MITASPTNDGRGRAYGFDLFLAKRAVSSNTRLTGWLAYTFTSAHREAYGRTYPFDYEQPHALSAVASYRVQSAPGAVRAPAASPPASRERCSRPVRLWYRRTERQRDP